MAHDVERALQRDAHFNSSDQCASRLRHKGSLWLQKLQNTSTLTSNDTYIASPCEPWILSQCTQSKSVCHTQLIIQPPGEHLPHSSRPGRFIKFCNSLTRQTHNIYDILQFHGLFEIPPYCNKFLQLLCEIVKFLKTLSGSLRNRRFTVRSAYLRSLHQNLTCAFPGAGTSIQSK